MNLKSNKKLSSRSKCVVCGKVRFRVYLVKQRCLNGSLVWVCSSSLGNVKTLVNVGGNYFTLHPCIMGFISEQKKELLLHQKNFDANLRNLWFYDELLTIKNVAPELTFFLQ